MSDSATRTEAFLLRVLDLQDWWGRLRGESPERADLVWAAIKRVCARERAEILASGAYESLPRRTWMLHGPPFGFDPARQPEGWEW